MRKISNQGKLSRRQMLGRTAGSAIAAPLLQSAILSGAAAADTPTLNGVAGIDRVAILPGKTYLRGWAGYGAPPQSNRQPRPGDPPPAPAPTGPEFTTQWSKESGPGEGRFADAKA